MAKLSEETKAFAKANNYPDKWWVRGEFTDLLGNVYKRGVLVRSADAPPDPLEFAPPQKTNFDEVKTLPKDHPKVQKSETQQLLEEMQRMRTELNELRSKQNAPQFNNPVFREEKVPFGVYSQPNMPDDDFMEVAKEYITVGKGWYLSEYTLQGRLILSPTNQPIPFTRAWDEQSGEKGQVITFSSYKTNSKQVAKFIEDSPYFGITVHTSKERAERVDLAAIDKIEGVILGVQRLDPHGVLSLATSLGIDTRQSEDKIRAAITKIKVQQAIQREGELIRQRVTVRDAENEIFKQANEAK